jgi:hypothetical protein
MGGLYLWGVTLEHVRLLYFQLLLPGLVLFVSIEFSIECIAILALMGISHSYSPCFIRTRTHAGRVAARVEWSFFYLYIFVLFVTLFKLISTSFILVITPSTLYT